MWNNRSDKSVHNKRRLDRWFNPQSAVSLVYSPFRWGLRWSEDGRFNHQGRAKLLDFLQAEDTRAICRTGGSLCFRTHPRWPHPFALPSNPSFNMWFYHQRSDVRSSRLMIWGRHSHQLLCICPRIMIIAQSVEWVHCSALDLRASWSLRAPIIAKITRGSFDRGVDDLLLLQTEYSRDHSVQRQYSQSLSF